MLTRLFLTHFKQKIGSINKTADRFLYSAGIFSCAPVDQRDFCLHILHRLVQQTLNEFIPVYSMENGSLLYYTEGFQNISKCINNNTVGNTVGQMFISIQVA